MKPETIEAIEKISEKKYPMNFNYRGVHRGDFLAFHTAKQQGFIEACKILLIEHPEILALEDYHKIDVSELRHKIETRISKLNAADVDFCKDRWDRPEIHPLQKAMAREESNKVTFARRELQEILKILPPAPIKTEVK